MDRNYAATSHCRGRNPVAGKPEYSVACPDIDAEREALSRIAAELFAAIDQGHSQAHLEQLFARLLAYARFNFQNEEALMRQSRFPEYAEHLREHRAFTDRARVLESELLQGISAIDRQALGFLEEWQEHHACGPDGRLGRHLAAFAMRSAIGPRTYALDAGL